MLQNDEIAFAAEKLFGPALFNTKKHKYHCLNEGKENGRISKAFFIN